jgi:uncharacterized protein YecT (DUF1311 family)
MRYLHRLGATGERMNGSRRSRPFPRAVALSVAGALVIGAIAAAPVAVEAGGRAATDPYERCLRSGHAAEGVMPAIEDCNRAELDRRDQELNRLYADLIRRLPSTQVRSLRSAERAWIQRRHRTCRQEGAGDSQDANVAFLQCLVNETAGRIEWLRSRYKSLVR